MLSCPIVVTTSHGTCQIERTRFELVSSGRIGTEVTPHASTVMGAMESEPCGVAERLVECRTSFERWRSDLREQCLFRSRLLLSCTVDTTRLQQTGLLARETREIGGRCRQTVMP